MSGESICLWRESPARRRRHVFVLPRALVADAHPGRWSGAATSDHGGTWTNTGELA